MCNYVLDCQELKLDLMLVFILVSKFITVVYDSDAGTEVLYQKPVKFVSGLK